MMLPLAVQRLSVIFVPLRAPGVTNGRAAVGGFRPFADLSKIPQKRLLAPVSDFMILQKGGIVLLRTTLYRAGCAGRQIGRNAERAPGGGVRWPGGSLSKTYL